MRLALIQLLILAFLVVGGCSVSREGQKVTLSANASKPTQSTPGTPDPLEEKIQEMILKYHNWLRSTRQLLGWVAPYDPHGFHWQPHPVDPTTHRRLPKWQVPLSERIEACLNDPECLKSWDSEKQKL